MPLHLFHFTVFDDEAVFERARKSEAYKRFVHQLYLHIDQSTSVSPACNSWLLDGSGTPRSRDERSCRESGATPR